MGCSQLNFIKPLLFCLVIGLLPFEFHSQESLPFFTSFEDELDEVLWTHYSDLGDDDWEMGVPIGEIYSSAASGAQVWGTNLSGNAAVSSVQYLQSPVFDISSLPDDYVLSFWHQIDVSFEVVRKVEFSLNGSDWNLLEDEAFQQSWQEVEGFDFDNWIGYSSINLSFLSGNEEVSFRFLLETQEDSSTEGWQIDDFKIDSPEYNISAFTGGEINITQNCTDFDVVSSFGFVNEVDNESYPVSVEYFWSEDDQLDEFDVYLEAFEMDVFQSGSPTHNISVPNDLPPGQSYLICFFDAEDELPESNELDNISTRILWVEEVFDLPYSTDFEEASDWTTNVRVGNIDNYWDLGVPTDLYFPLAHSGNMAWHTSGARDEEYFGCYGCNIQEIISPRFDLTTGEGDLIMNFWAAGQYSNPHLNGNNLCEYAYSEIEQLNISSSGWTNHTFSLNEYVDQNNTNFSLSLYLSSTDPNGHGGGAIDDVYIGPSKADLYIVDRETDRFTSGNQSTFVLDYSVGNCGVWDAEDNVTSYYWSNDPVLDDTDIDLGQVNNNGLGANSTEQVIFSFEKPNLSEGIYYLFYQLDAQNQVDEMRENNNSGFWIIEQSTPESLPYVIDFEDSDAGWTPRNSRGVEQWVLAQPDTALVRPEFQEGKAWISNFNEHLNPMSLSHLYSPLFDLNGLDTLVLEFDMQLVDPYLACLMEYSIDGGNTWQYLDTSSTSSSRWYSTFGFYSVDTDEHGETVYSTALGYYAPKFPYDAMSNGRYAPNSTTFNVDISSLVGEPSAQFRLSFGNALGTLDAADSVAVSQVYFDRFSLKGGTYDLELDGEKELMISPLATYFEFFTHVCNRGNYESDPSSIDFYLSSDTILSDDDLILWTEELKTIPPYSKQYINLRFDMIDGVEDYHYVLYDIDPTGSTNDSDANNNSGQLGINSDGVSQFPYYNDFSDEQVDGWHQFTEGDWWDGLDNRYRFRNKLAVNEPKRAQKGLQNDEFFTEKILDSDFIDPHYYLVTPSYDFSMVDSIHLSFEVMCTGVALENGGNFQYFVPDDPYWDVLEEGLGESSGWYPDFSVLSDLYNQKGWSGLPSQAEDGGYLHPATYDLSFLKGKSDVVFRFHYYSNHYFTSEGFPLGMRVDDFLIEAFEMDIDLVVDPQSIEGQLDEDLTIDYTLSFYGDIGADSTLTGIYWSDDQELDESDVLVMEIQESEYSSGQSYSNTVQFTPPGEIEESEYWVIVVADHLNQEVEYDETNNIQMSHVTYSYVNYSVVNGEDTLFVPQGSSTIEVPYKIKNIGAIDGMNSTTTFRLSDDVNQGLNEPLLLSIDESAILAGDSIVETAVVNVPFPIEQEMYYLAYKADGEYEVEESAELDNLATYVLVMEGFVGLDEVHGNAKASQVAVIGGNLSTYLSNQHTPGNYRLTLVSLNGKLVYEQELWLNLGANLSKLPSSLAGAVYFITLANSQDQIQNKCLFGK